MAPFDLMPCAARQASRRAFTYDTDVVALPSATDTAMRVDYEVPQDNFQPGPIPLSFGQTKLSANVREIRFGVSARSWHCPTKLLILLKMSGN